MYVCVCVWDRDTRTHCTVLMMSSSVWVITEVTLDIIRGMSCRQTIVTESVDQTVAFIFLLNRQQHFLPGILQRLLWALSRVYNVHVASDIFLGVKAEAVLSRSSVLKKLITLRSEQLEQEKLQCSVVRKEEALKRDSLCCWRSHAFIFKHSFIKVSEVLEGTSECCSFCWSRRMKTNF